MKLEEGTQITVLLWPEPQQFTVKQIDKDTAVHVQSNVQPLGMIVYPTDYRPGVTLHKLGQPGTKGW